jgi:hypothetical protein
MSFRSTRVHTGSRGFTQVHRGHSAASAAAVDHTVEGLVRVDDAPPLKAPAYVPQHESYPPTLGGEQVPSSQRRSLPSAPLSRTARLSTSRRRA